MENLLISTGDSCQQQLLLMQVMGAQYGRADDVVLIMSTAGWHPAHTIFMVECAFEQRHGVHARGSFFVEECAWVSVLLSMHLSGEFRRLYGTWW